MNHTSFFGIPYFNDLAQIHETEILKKIKLNAEITPTYISMLICSSIVCTLGLIIDNTPFIIGGMMISPITWPLVKIALGISYGQRTYIRQAFILLVFSMFVSILSAFIITYLSPIKIVTDSILALTQPTIIDIIVAIVVGAIAALAITQPRISEILAGIAIATSVMQPLCAAGIGIALGDKDIFINSFLLFTANIVSIIFITIIVFLLLGIKKETQSALRREGIIFIAIILIITAIPLFTFFQKYSFRVVAYHTIQKLLTDTIHTISPDAHIEDIQTRISTNNQMYVDAVIWLSDDSSRLDYQQQQYIVDTLEKKLHKKVNLNLRIQRNLSIVSEQDKRKSWIEKTLSTSLDQEIKKTNEAFIIDTIVIEKVANQWNVNTVLRADPALTFTEENRTSIEKTLSKIIEEKVALNIDIIPRIRLQSKPDLLREQKLQTIKKELLAQFPTVHILNLSLQENEKGVTLISIDMRLAENDPFNKKKLETLRTQLKNKLHQEIELTLNISKFQTITTQ